MKLISISSTTPPTPENISPKADTRWCDIWMTLQDARVHCVVLNVRSIPPLKTTRSPTVGQGFQSTPHPRKGVRPAGLPGPNSMHPHTNPEQPTHQFLSPRRNELMYYGRRAIKACFVICSTLELFASRVRRRSNILCTTHALRVW